AHRAYNSEKPYYEQAKNELIISSISFLVNGRLVPSISAEKTWPSQLISLLQGKKHNTHDELFVKFPELRGELTSTMINKYGAELLLYLAHQYLNRRDEKAKTKAYFCFQYAARFYDCEEAHNYLLSLYKQARTRVEKLQFARLVLNCYSVKTNCLEFFKWRRICILLGEDTKDAYINELASKAYDEYQAMADSNKDMADFFGDPSPINPC
ncbi:MAG TPA: hypothetical protein VD770_04430, partial [Coxiellaceae bacterium]|nr:hypothetical protein [Coxiellaceae bacterium]